MVQSARARKRGDTRLITIVQRWWHEVRAPEVSSRRAAAMAVISGVALITLVVIWLTVSTRTALLNQQLDVLDAEYARLTDEINQAWVEIGRVTAPRVMEERARRLGFRPAERIEYLVMVSEATPAVTTTLAAKP